MWKKEWQEHITGEQCDVFNMPRLKRRWSYGFEIVRPLFKIRHKKNQNKYGAFGIQYSYSEYTRGFNRKNNKIYCNNLVNWAKFDIFSVLWLTYLQLPQNLQQLHLIQMNWYTRIMILFVWRGFFLPQTSYHYTKLYSVHMGTSCKGLFSCPGSVVKV